MPTRYYRQALNAALREEMRRDESVFLAGEEVAQYQGAYRVSEGLLEEFGPRRVQDTPIAEEVVAGVGIGSAMAGLRPVVEMMTVNFALLAMDQIVNHAAKLLYMSNGQMKIPIVIRAPEGAGMQLGAQHSQNLEAWFVHVPGLRVVAPGTPYDAKGLLKSAIRDDNPVIFLEHELLYTMKGDVPNEEYIIPLGKADVKRKGSDVTIVTYLRGVSLSMKAADKLAENDVDVEIVDLRTLRPMDVDTIIESVKKTHRLVVVEEDWPQCGLGAQVVDFVQHRAFDYLDAPMLRVTLADTPMPYSGELEQSALPSPDKIYSAVMAVLVAS